MALLRHGIITFIFTLVLALNLAAKIELEVKLSESTLYLGDEITLQLNVNGTRNDINLTIPEVNGLSFRQHGPPSSSSQTYIVNGKVTSFNGLIYHIGISASRVGSYNIPGITVEHGGQKYTSKAFHLTVKKADQVSKMKVVTEISSKKIYLDEPLDVTLKWYLQNDIEDYSFRFPLLDIKDKVNLQLVERGGSGTTTNLSVDNYKIPFRQSNETLNNETYTVYSTRFQLYPEVSGKFTIAAASVKAMVRQGTEQKRDIFGRIVRTPKLKRIFAVSEAVDVIVQPLPRQNRPITFTGGVGNYDIQITADATRVKVGDPIEITMKITGEGRLDKIEQPVLTENPGFSKDFVIVDNLQPGDVQENSIVFKQIIRPRKEGIDKIPSVEFSFFNPVSETYKTIQSNSLPLKVLSAKRVSADDIIVNKADAIPAGRVLKRKKRGIYANYAFEDALVSQTPHWAWLLFLIIPPMGYVSLAIGARRYNKLRNNQSLVRAKSAKGTKNKRLKKAKKLMLSEGDRFYLELSQALKGYIADKLNLGAGELTTIDIKKLGENKRLQVDVLNSIIECLEEFDRMRFMQQENTADERQKMFDKVADLMKILEKQI